MNNIDAQSYNYPKLQSLKEFFADDVNKSDVATTVIVACQHLLRSQKEMFKTLIQIGFLPEHIFVVGKAYSTNYEILQEISEMGIHAVQPPFDPTVSFDIQHEQNCKSIWEVAAEARSHASKIIIMDDGAALLQYVIQQDLSVPVVGVEQTSSGFRKLEHVSLLFPIYNVARSKVKLELETPHVVRLGVSRLEEKINELKLVHPNILIVGLGAIGAGMEQLLIEKGYRVTSYDEIHGKQDVIELVKNNIQVVVGTTGSQILSHDELLLLHGLLQEKLLLASMSSSDREFELWKLRDLFRQGTNIHGDVSFGNIIITNNGFPITFKGNRFESLPQEMERTMCLLFSGVCLAVIDESLPTGLIDIPEHIANQLI